MIKKSIVYFLSLPVASGGSDKQIYLGEIEPW